MVLNSSFVTIFYNFSLSYILRSFKKSGSKTKVNYEKRNLQDKIYIIIYAEYIKKGVLFSALSETKVATSFLKIKSQFRSFQLRIYHMLIAVLAADRGRNRRTSAPSNRV